MFELIIQQKLNKLNVKYDLAHIKKWGEIIMSDTIKKFTKRKGFESIPRELLQSKELTLEAIGLLCNLQSYPENWVLHKTELRKRFINKEKVVDRIWDELVSHGYIMQFRKRVGKKYEYQYFFNVEKFTLDEVQTLCSEMHDDGMTLYHKAMLKSDKNSAINYKDYLHLSDEDKDKLDLEFWTFQNGNLKKTNNSNDFSGSQNGKSNLDIPKREGIKLTNNRFTTNISDIEDLKNLNDDDDNNNNSDNEVLLKINEIISRNLDYKNLTLILRHRNVTPRAIYAIISYFDNNPGIFNKNIIKQQLEWMAEKSEKEVGISNFEQYFINGYNQRIESKNGSQIEDLDTLLGLNNKKLPKISLHNWAEGE